MIVQLNLLAMNSNRMLGLTNTSQSKSTERLSSGYRINRSADDAAGLAISEKMRRQIRGLTQASENAQDGISFCQIADGALNEVQDMLKRATQLATQAANGTNSDGDREYIQKEIDALSREIDRVHSTSTFNEKRVFPDDGLPLTNVAPASDVFAQLPIQIEVEWNFVDATGSPISPTEVQKTGTDNSYADSDMAKFIVKAASDAAAEIMAAYPNLMSAASSSGIKIGLNCHTMDGVGNILASAQLSMSSSSTSATMSYTMNVDTSDYPLDGFASMSDAKKADLAATIAHEMTHLVMYDTLTDGMLGGFPKWFVEGMAQTSSGDNGWVSYSIDASSSDAAIKSYMSKLNSMPYGAGYLGVMTLGMSASGSTTVSSANIKSGLDKLMTDMATNKHSLSEAIAATTSFASQADFVSKFTSGNADVLATVKDILAARGTGAGSLLSTSLSATETNVFSDANLNKSASSYTVDASNKRFSNAYGSGYVFPDPSSSEGGDGFCLQVGSEAGQTILVNQFNMSAISILNGETLDVTTVEGATQALETLRIGDANVSKVRSYYGAMQNRLEHTINNLNNVVENTTAAESAIRDTDMATEIVKYSNYNVLAQAGQAMLAQANQSKQGILNLLQ